MQEMSRDDQRNTPEEGKVCDVLRSRLTNVLKGRCEGGGLEHRKG